MRLFAPLLFVLMSGCVGVVGGVTTGPTPLPPPEGPEVFVRVARIGPAAANLVHEVAARCWLDGVLRAGTMTVNRSTGRIELSDDRGLMVAADYVENVGLVSRWRLSGPSVASPVIVDRLVSSLDRAVKTGETGCPILAT